jgi:L-asparaginase/Glu-tRNA(Gln) amidotransferase subunit D
MTAQGNGSEVFVVHCSGTIAKAIRHAHEQATNEGRGPHVTKAFRQLIRRLERDPFQVGEPIYRLPSLKMQIRTTVILPLAFGFGVCEDRPLVFIRFVKLLSSK